MAYSEQTSVANAASVIDRIANFAGANGWTVHRNDDPFGLGVRTATLRKPGVSDYIHFYNTDFDVVRMRVSKGYDSDFPPADQPNVSAECRCTLQPGPYPKMFLFASGDQVWVAFAIALSGEYRHLTFGVLDKVGDYPGGTYVDATDWGNTNRWATFQYNHAPFFPDHGGTLTPGRGVVSADVADDGRENFFFRFGTSYNAGSSPAAAMTEIGDETRGLTGTLVMRADKNAFSGRSILHAIPVFITRTGASTYLSPIGIVQDVRFCSINKFEPEQEVTIASDTYVIFPVIAKRTMNGSLGVQPSASGEYAFAIRKVV